MFFLWMFEYSCLHFPTTTSPHPTNALLFLTPPLLWNSIIAILPISCVPLHSNQQGFNIAVLDNFPKSLKFPYKISLYPPDLLFHH